MLGLCWKPAAIQGMQKVANSMPSNPEQLLGAILVRRDIFQRFENTMQDTCLDANNLLEYLFSLYNSQIRRQSRPFSPGSAQNIGPTTPVDASGQKFNLDGSLDQSLATDTSMEQSDNNNSKLENTPLKDSNSGLPRRKRPKRHQCFCGALFTRADNLKRHIRKCHEEKLEKLTAVNSETEGGGDPQAPTNAAFEEFQQLYPAAGQDMQQEQPPQQQQQQQLQQQEQDHHLQQHDQHQHQQQQQQQQQQHPHQPQTPSQQQDHVLNDVRDVIMNKSVPPGGVKWSCFCGESFEDHRQLVEHTRVHEANA